jgi:hypothetical protein
MQGKVISSMAGILLATLACGIVAPAPAPTQQQPGVETIVVQTLEALTLAAPPATQASTVEVTVTQPPQPSGVQVTFQNISFMIPNGLATGADPEVVPAVGPNDGAPWDVAPAYSKFSLTGYPLQGKFFEPYFVVYPAHEFESANEGAASSLKALREIIANPSAPLTPEVIPGVPTFNAGMAFASNMQILHSQNLTGVRALTEYAQYFAPINNREMIYQFQGLTNDGTYYVIAILPINAPFLAADEDPAAAVPGDGVPFPDYNTADDTQFETYYQAITEKLNSTGPDSFSPPLGQLDALIQSITVAQ